MMKTSRLLVGIVVALAVALSPGVAASAGTGGPATIFGSLLVATDSGIQPYVGEVVLIDANSPSFSITRQSANGEFQFDGLAPATYIIRFGEESNLVPTMYWPGHRDQAAAELITVGIGESRGLDQKVVQQGGIIRGFVLTATDDPADSLISLWKIDETTGAYAHYLDRANDSFGLFDAGVVEAGRYVLWARPNDETGLGSEWYADARYFADSVEIIVAKGQTVQFNDMVLEPRYFDIDRLAGANRFETAVEITRAIYGDPLSVDPPSVIYLTNAYNYPDALAAGPAAIHAGGAILPVAQNGAPDVILDEIQRLGPARIVVMGAENAVSKAVVDQVSARVSVPITRHAGVNRYDTAGKAIREAFGPASSQYAFIVTGQNFPDALAAGAAAGYLGAPVILVPGSGSDLPASTADLLDHLGVDDVMIAGGPTTVSQGIEDDLRQLLGTQHVERFAGANRYQTAAMINAAVFAGSERALLASGVGFADALAGGPLAGVMGAPLYLSPQHCVPDDTYFQLWDQDVQGVTLLGGLPTLGVGVEELAAC